MCSPSFTPIFEKALAVAADRQLRRLAVGIFSNDGRVRVMDAIVSAPLPIGRRLYVKGEDFAFWDRDVAFREHSVGRLMTKDGCLAKSGGTCWRAATVHDRPGRDEAMHDR
jgi:hypothetical protein